jgi:hypothetical protein
MSPEEMERDKVTDRRTSLLDAWRQSGSVPVRTEAQDGDHRAPGLEAGFRDGGSEFPAAGCVTVGKIMWTLPLTGWGLTPEAWRTPCECEASGVQLRRSARVRSSWVWAGLRGPEQVVASPSGVVMAIRTASNTHRWPPSPRTSPSAPPACRPTARSPTMWPTRWSPSPTASCGHVQRSERTPSRRSRDV